MSKTDKQARIDAHLLGRNTPEERREMDEEISRNADLSEQVNATELAMAAVELAEDRALKARLQQLESTLAKNAPLVEAPPAATVEAKVVGMKKQARSPMRWYAIAATLLLLLAVGWWALRPAGTGDPGQLAMADFEPYPNIAYQIERGGDDQGPEKAAYLAYEEGDFAAAAAAFRDLDPTAVRRFYFGQSLLATEDFAEAEAIFTTLSATEDFNLARESAYYLAVALVGQGKTAAARQRLATIVATEDHPSLREARQLLKRL